MKRDTPMSKENRSSTIEQHDHIEGIIDMVSVPREVIEFAAGLKWHGYKSGTDQKDDQLQALNKLRAILAKPAPLPHPDPIAWMVGTALWWTKEEAERDAAATGLPIVGLGPMSGVAPAEQPQGEPVAVLYANGTVLTKADCGDVFDICCKVETPLYTHPDSGEVERLREDLGKYIARANDFASKMQDAQSEAGAFEGQLAECAIMAAMIEEREWAEHVGTGPVSSKVEAAFTQLHNDLHEAGEKLTEREALLRELADAPPAAMEFRLQQKVRAALSASAEPSAPVLKRHHDVTMFQCGEAKP